MKSQIQKGERKKKKMKEILEIVVILERGKKREPNDRGKG